MITNLPPVSIRHDPSLHIKDKADYERQVAEWAPTLQLIGRYRLGKEARNAVRYKLEQLHDLWMTVCLLSVKIPNLIYNTAQMRKSMPDQGNNVLRMRRATDAHGCSVGDCKFKDFDFNKTQLRILDGF
jgi:hypothetical protein